MARTLGVCGVYSGTTITLDDGTVISGVSAGVRGRLRITINAISCGDFTRTIHNWDLSGNPIEQTLHYPYKVDYTVSGGKYAHSEVYLKDLGGLAKYYKESIGERMLKIKMNERKIYEQSLKFLDKALKEIEFDLPSLYTSEALAVFKGKEPVDSDVAWDIETLSWDVDSATTSGNYLMVAFKDNPGEDSVKDIMQSEYKKAVLPEALELVDYIDVGALRNALGDIARKSDGTDWQLDYSLGDIQDLADAPGVIDCVYAEADEYDENDWESYTVISVCVGAFGFLIGRLGGTDAVETTDPAEAEKTAQEFVAKFGTKSESVRKGVNESYNPRTCKIGSQVWSAENLDINDGGEGIYKRGGVALYTWDAAMRVVKRIPGWHLPSKQEFLQLFKACGGKDVAGKKLKSTSGWIGEGNGTDDYGFSAFPVGIKGNEGHYAVGSHTRFWAATQNDTSDYYVYSMYLMDYDDAAEIGNSHRYNNWYSVRLIKD